MVSKNQLSCKITSQLGKNLVYKQTRENAKLPFRFMCSKVKLQRGLKWCKFMEACLRRQSHRQITVPCRNKKEFSFTIGSIFFLLRPQWRSNIQLPLPTHSPPQYSIERELSGKLALVGRSLIQQTDKNPQNQFPPMHCNVQ